MLLNCLVEKDDVRVVWKLDNLNGIIYDENGNVVGEPLKDSPKEFKPLYFPNKNESKQHTFVTKLNVILGQKCNFHCTYCTEKVHTVTGYDATPEDVPHFIELLKQYNIRTRTIEIWGGEPLVYWKTLELLIPALRELYPTQKLTIKTNGSLLDDEKIDFFMKYDVILPISDDIDNRDRGVKAVTNITKMYKKYNEWAKKMGHNLQICMQTTPSNCDSYAILQQVKKFFPNLSPDTFFVEMLRVPYGMKTEDFPFRFTEEDLRIVFHSTIKRLVYDQSPIQGDYRYVKYYYEFLKNHSFLCMNGFNLKNGHTMDSRCDSATGERIQLDMKGNLFRCKLTSAISDSVGNIHDLENVKYTGFSSSLSREHCPSCPLISLCRGVCSRMEQEELTETCRARYVYFYTYFKVAFESLCKVKLLAIDTPVPTANIVNFLEPEFDYKTKKIIGISPE